MVSKYCLGAALLIAGVALTQYLSLAVIIASTMISIIAVYVYSSRNFSLVIVLLVLLSFISLGIAILLIDTSIDGQIPFSRRLRARSRLEPLSRHVPHNVEIGFFS